MTLLQALILGLIQGFGEFLPISSSGHLIIAQHLLKLPDAEAMLPFDVLLHVATLVAVIVYFRDDLTKVLRAWLRSIPIFLRDGWYGLRELPEAKWGWLILLTMVPTGLVALGLKHVSDVIEGHEWMVAACLAIAGTLNWYSHGRTKTNEGGKPIEELGARGALWCGLAQGLAAVFHGMSRSGSTIAAGYARGLDTDAAPRFSFLMLIPAVACAALLEVPKLVKHHDHMPVSAMAVGFIVAAVTGYVAVGMVVQLAHRHRFRGFAIYCWVISVVGLILFTTR